VAVCLSGCLVGCGGGTSSQSRAVSSGTTTISDYASPTSQTSTSAAASTTGNTLARGFHLSSPAFTAGGAIPARYTCDGADVSLPLAITGVPAGTRELVLIMRDPDAPTGNFVHWALAGIPPSTRALSSGGVPGLVAPGRNSFGTLGYRGPCPPAAQTHHYVLSLDALGGASGLKPGFSADQLHTAALGIATLIGTYSRR
jgi:hypothetical protein